MLKKNFSLARLQTLPMVASLRLAQKLGLSKLLVKLLSKNINSEKGKRRAFAGYEATKHDVFVCCYSKSGTYWTMQIAQQIAYYGQAEFEHIHDLIPWPDSAMPQIVSLTDPRPQEEAPTGLRVIKSHLESDYLPYSKQAKYVAVIRDPKDVFVSSYYFAQAIVSQGRLIFSPQEWLDYFMSDDFIFGSWAKHTASLWAWRERDNVLVLTFNEMKRDHTGSVRRIAALMGVTLTEAQLAKVVEKSSLKYMKNINDKFLPPILAFGKKEDRAVIVRQGKSRGASELINAEQQATLDRFCQDELHRLGSDFPYREIFQQNSPSSQD